jgi:hypothetical protein
MSNSDDKLNSIKELLDLISNEYRNITDLKKQITLANTKIEQMEKILLKICNHKWEYDNCYGMYEKPDKICRICNSRKVRF